MVQSTHPRRRAGIERQDIRADLANDAMSGGFVRDVGADRVDPQPLADCFKRLGTAGDDSHPCALGDEGFDQSQSKATASAGDEDGLVFKAHLFCSTDSL